MKLPVSLLFACLTTATMAQRSPYAPKPVGYPTVLEQYMTNTDTAGNNVPNRFGGVDESYAGPLKPEPGTIGDPYLVPHLPEWPKEHQPFWYLNQQHIMNHVGQKVPAPGNANTAQTAGQAAPARNQQQLQQQRQQQLQQQQLQQQQQRWQQGN